MRRKCMAFPAESNVMRNITFQKRKLGESQITLDNVGF